jgi:hypothetical protein
MLLKWYTASNTAKASLALAGIGDVPLEKAANVLISASRYMEELLLLSVTSYMLLLVSERTDAETSSPEDIFMRSNKASTTLLFVLLAALADGDSFEATVVRNVSK